MAGVLEALRGRGKVELFQAQVPVVPVEEAIDTAVTAFDTHLADIPTLEVLDPFKRWREASPAQVREQVVSHIDNLFRNSRRMDACRAVSDLAVVVFDTRQHLRGMHVTAEEYTRLGDGTAVHLGGGSWGFTQKKGVNINLARFSVRQKAP